MMVKIPIMVEIATNGSGIFIRKPIMLRKRIENTKKLAKNDHKVKNLNCFPNPASRKIQDPDKKKISAKKIDVNIKQIVRYKNKKESLGNMIFIFKINV